MNLRIGLTCNPPSSDQLANRFDMQSTSFRPTLISYYRLSGDERARMDVNVRSFADAVYCILTDTKLTDGDSLVFPAQKLSVLLYQPMTPDYVQLEAVSSTQKDITWTRTTWKNMQGTIAMYTWMTRMLKSFMKEERE
jgi:hypothetical protein